MRMLNVLLIAFVFVAVYKTAVEAHAQLTLHLYLELYNTAQGNEEEDLA